MENVANVVNALAQIGNPYIPHASKLLLIDELESLFWTSFVEWMIEYCPSDPGHGAKSIYTMGSNIFCGSIIAILSQFLPFYKMI